MNRTTRVCIGFVIIAILASGAYADSGRIYGKIYTDRGDVLEGPIRWDKNEGFWIDMMDGNKQRPQKTKKTDRRKYGEDDREVSFFGFTIYKEGSGWSSVSQSCIPFGQIKTLTPNRDDGVELELKSGQIVEFRNGSSDFGDGIREIVVETAKDGAWELEWSDIDHIEFMDGDDAKSDYGDGIYGTVSTSRGGEYTGSICWDADELFMDDIVDGKEHHRNRKIKFSQIARIERISSQASLIVLKDGTEIRLDDSNDVDSGNRGITVSNRDFGRVIVEWDEFESLDIKPPPRDAFPRYDDYDGGELIYGTAYDVDGESFEGNIRWDNDEEYTWEILDGNYRGVEFDIPFSQIKSIERYSSRSSLVTLWNGDRYRLRDSNDVNDENKGIFIKTPNDRDEVELDWDDFDHVEFRHP